MKFDACLAFTLAQEGGMSRDSADRGCWLGGMLVGSNLGISAPVLATAMRAAGQPAAPKDVAFRMARLGVDDVRPIYLAKYWQPVLGDALAPGIDLMLFDHAVNAGVSTSIRLLQGVLGVTLDGAMAPGGETVTAAIKRWPSELIFQLYAAQQDAYGRMPGSATFGRGWLARLERRRAAAEAMNAADVQTITGEFA